MQSSTSRLIARWLGVAEPAPKGFLIVGANAFSRAVAKELVKHDFRCVLSDSNWEHIRLARMDGLETFYGNPVSEHADFHLDLSGIGGLLAMSRQRHVNTIAAVHFRGDFGTERIFSLVSAAEVNKTDKHKVSESYLGSQLFGQNVTYSELVTKIAKGNEVKSTTLTEEFGWDTFTEKYTESRLPLFMIDPNGRIKPFTSGNQLSPKAGSIILALETSEDGAEE